MKTKAVKAVKTEKKENSTFAFLPEMILDHLNEAKPTQTTKENANEVRIEKIIITAEPNIPNLDSIFENNKESVIATTAKIENQQEIILETIDDYPTEFANNETQENIITRFLKKIKH